MAFLVSRLPGRRLMLPLLAFFALALGMAQPASAAKLVFEKACTDPQRVLVREAFAAAGPMVNHADAAVSAKRWSATTTKLYKKWFGVERDDLVTTVRDTLAAMKRRFSDRTTFTVECKPKRCQAGEFARTSYQSDYFAFCQAFFDAPLRGPDSRVGTLLHEMSHNAADTDDLRYGRVDCERLAKGNPNDAVKNADNYEYFIEDLEE